MLVPSLISRYHVKAVALLISDGRPEMVGPSAIHRGIRLSCGGYSRFCHVVHRHLLCAGQGPPRRSLRAQDDGVAIVLRHRCVHRTQGRLGLGMAALGTARWDGRRRRLQRLDDCPGRLSDAHCKEYGSGYRAVEFRFGTGPAVRDHA